jgi:hypothetical protein
MIFWRDEEGRTVEVNKINKLNKSGRWWFFAVVVAYILLFVLFSGTVHFNV